MNEKTMPIKLEFELWVRLARAAAKLGMKRGEFVLYAIKLVLEKMEI